MPLVTDIGHIVIQVGNMEQALRLYRDTLGFEVDEQRSQHPVWMVLRTKGGEVTLYQPGKVLPLALRDGEGSPIELHVASFEDAANQLRAKEYSIKRYGESSGILIDPWGNHIGLHDHRKG